MMLISQAAQVLGARSTGMDAKFTAVSSDTRKIREGSLFVALRGERFDGYDFVAQALQSGAVAAMVNADSYAAKAALLDANAALLVVSDTRLALGQLAAYWRSQFSLPVVGVTGSNGKTTVKEMLASILRLAAGNDTAVLATQGNLNNDIGLPLTVLQLTQQHHYAVIEMGMNHLGEIDYLSRIARPDVAIINNASGAHLEGLGSVTAVAQAKGEILAGLSAQGVAVLNADDAHVGLWRDLAGSHELLEFGLKAGADVQGMWRSHDIGLVMDAFTPQGRLTATLQVPGEHNARNALAAITAAVALNIPLETISLGLEKFSAVTGRLQRKTTRQGSLLLDDTYNANPASLRAAIAVLAALPGKRVLVLGDMGELGSGAAEFHQDIGAAARAAGIENLYALGELSRHAVRAFGDGGIHFEQIEVLQARLDEVLDRHTCVLVKGSRFMKMERVVAHCLATPLNEESH